MNLLIKRLFVSPKFFVYNLTFNQPITKVILKFLHFKHIKSSQLHVVTSNLLK
jgi:hypothetical protein